MSIGIKLMIDQMTERVSNSFSQLLCSDLVTASWNLTKTFTCFYVFICCPFHPCLPFLSYYIFCKMCNKTSRRRWRRFLQCLENFSSPADLCFLLRTVLFGTLILRLFPHDALITFSKACPFLLSHNCVVTSLIPQPTCCWTFSKSDGDSV